MDTRDFKTELTHAGILHENGHFVGTNREHLSVYLDLDPMYEPRNQALKEKIGRSLAQKLKDQEIQVVTGPANGGNLLSSLIVEYLRQLPENTGVITIPSVKTEGSFSYAAKDIEKMRDKKILIVDDVFRTGFSLRKLLLALQAQNLQPAAYTVVVNRHLLADQSIDGIPVAQLIHIPLESWPEDSCALCRNGIPVNTETGHGREFLDRQRK